MAKGDTLNILKNHRPNNLIINGAMDNWQRGTSFTGLSTQTYGPDRFYIAPPAGGNLDMAQSTDVPNASFDYSVKITNQGVLAAPTGSNFSNFLQRIYFKDSFKFKGKRASFSCWVKTNKAGIYTFFMYMGAGSVIYQMVTHATLTAGAWTKVKFKSAGPLPYDFTNSTNQGGYIGVGLSAGPDVQSAATVDWTRIPDVSVIRGVSGGVNFHDTVGNELYITGMMVTDAENENEEFQYAGGSRLVDDYLCQLFYQKMQWSTSSFIAPVYASGTVCEGRIQYYKKMISIPTVSVSSASDFRLYNSGLHGGVQFTMAGISPNLGAIDSTYLYISGTSGLTSGALYFLQAFNTSAYIALNAEI